MTIAFRNRRPRRPAYTLIELLLVVALLGVASALLVPTLVGQDSLTVQAAVRQLIADMSFAQSDALAHQDFKRIQFFGDGSGYALIRADEYGDFDDPFDPATADYVEDPLAFGAENGRYVVDFTADDRFNGVSINSVDIDDGNTYITYDALGGTVVGGAGLPGIGGSLRLVFGAETYEVTISPFTGKLTVARIP